MLRSIFSLILLFSFQARADQPMLTGAWEVTTTLDPKAFEDSMKDLPEEARAMLKESMGNGKMTSTDCVTEEDLKEGFIPQEEGCTNKEISKTNLKWVYEMTCKDPVSFSKIEFTFGADKKTYTSVINSEVTEDGKKSKMSITQAGKWIKAACDAE
jgi:hypothetical protein